MKIILFILGLVALAAAIPVNQNATKSKDNGEDDNGNGEDNGNGKDEKKVKHGKELVPFIPFSHLDDLAVFVLGNLTVVAGSAFTVVDDEGGCQRILISDDKGGQCPMNQTTCDKISASLCAPAVANMTCIKSKHADKYNETNNEGYDQSSGEHKDGDYPSGGPLCHLTAFGRKFQPSSSGAIFTIQPDIQTCFFTVAPAPTLPPDTPEPTGEPQYQDPYCPFLE